MSDAERRVKRATETLSAFLEQAGWKPMELPVACVLVFVPGSGLEIASLGDPSLAKLLITQAARRIQDTAPTDVGHRDGFGVMQWGGGRKPS